MVECPQYPPRLPRHFSHIIKTPSLALSTDTTGLCLRGGAMRTTSSAPSRRSSTILRPFVTLDSASPARIATAGKPRSAPGRAFSTCDSLASLATSAPRLSRGLSKGMLSGCWLCVKSDQWLCETVGFAAYQCVCYLSKTYSRKGKLHQEETQPRWRPLKTGHTGSRGSRIVRESYAQVKILGSPKKFWKWLNMVL